MFGFLLSLLILDGLLLIVVVLLQAGKGGGLAAMGGGAGTETFLGGRQAANLLTRASWIGGGVFLFLALVLAVLSARQPQPRSILRQEFQQTAPAAPSPVLPGVQPSEDAAGEAQPGATTDDQSPAAPAPDSPSQQ